MTRFLYSARLVPMGRPVNIPNEDGTPSFETFHDKSFELDRKAKTKPDVCLNHDRAMVIGKLAMLYTSDNWCAATSCSRRSPPASGKYVSPCRSASQA